VASLALTVSLAPMASLAPTASLALTARPVLPMAKFIAVPLRAVAHDACAAAIGEDRVLSCK
jgi:hypothetical protein